MKFDVITVGSAVIDSFLETELEEEHGKIYFPIGTKILVKELWFSTGGGGTNTAASFSTLGLKTGYIGKLGKDENANIILNELKKFKVSFLGSQGTTPTGYSTIIDSKKLHRTVLTYKGANDSLAINELKLKNLNTHWFYFSAMLNNSLKTQEKLALISKKINLKIAYNPSSYLTRKGPNLIKNIIKYTNILVLNNEEAEHLVGKNPLLITFKKLHSLGPEIICITYGEKGNKASDKKNIFISKPHNIKPKERTGAGDAFASGFVTGVIYHNNIEKAIQFGSLNAESVIQIPGAKNGLLTKSQIEKQMKTNPVKIEVKKF
ncbi:carbohydrate kinase family protein [Candidatus Pacearchaeota archaeon]|nr:carbohydrate kinase family protein [Candidatus Pacearchaeota archaeon]